MTTFTNLTPHDITVRDADGVDHVFAKSGEVARVATSQETLAPIAGIPVRRTTTGTVEGLPDPQEGVAFIVSAMVLGRCAGRTDVFGPDSGPTAVRNEKGHIVAVTALVAAPVG